jgi:hypothetical protein
MIYKDDWEEAQQRMLAWWEGEIIDRVCLQVTAPLTSADGLEDPASFICQESADPYEYWTNVDYVIARTVERIQHTFWGGESFPLFWPNLGPDAFAAFFGADLHFMDRRTSWVLPIITDWQNAPVLRISEDNRWWRLQLELLAEAKARGDDKWITGIPDTHAGADALAALRGQSRLCLDLYDYPEEVKAAISRLLEAVLQVYEIYYQMVEAEKYGSSSGWLPARGPGRTNVVQCDFLAFVSPEMAEEFLLESIVAEARWLDHAIFHLDGPDAVRHLDLLLAIPEIQAIQWVPGARALPMTKWIPLLKRIQAAAKSLHLTVWPHEIRTLLEELKPEGLMLKTHVTCEAEASDLLCCVTRLS